MLRLNRAAQHTANILVSLSYSLTWNVPSHMHCGHLSGHALLCIIYTGLAPRSTYRVISEYFSNSNYMAENRWIVHSFLSNNWHYRILPFRQQKVDIALHFYWSLINITDTINWAPTVYKEPCVHIICIMWFNHHCLFLAELESGPT